MRNRQPHQLTTAQRGYGPNHTRVRAELAKRINAGAVVLCARGCGRRITPGMKFHLDHADHPRAHELGIYRGASCPTCNLRARNERVAALARLAEEHGLDVTPAPPAGEWVRASW